MFGDKRVQEIRDALSKEKEEEMLDILMVSHFL